MARGGFRKGSGRKKGLATIASEASKALVAQLVLEEIEPLTRGLIEKAKGNPDYKRVDVFAAKELYERALGKVTDKLQIQEVKKLLRFDE